MDFLHTTSKTPYYHFLNLGWSNLGFTSHEHPQNVRCWQFIHLLRSPNLNISSAEAQVLSFLHHFGRDLKPDLPDGSTRLHWIALLPFIKIAEFWLKYLIPDVTDSLGFTPLYIAASIGNVPMYKFLISKGADATKTQPNGLSPDQVFCFVCKVQNIDASTSQSSERKRAHEDDSTITDSNKRLKLNLFSLEQTSPLNVISSSPCVSPISGVMNSLRMSSPVHSPVPSFSPFSTSPRKGPASNSPRKDILSIPTCSSTKRTDLSNKLGACEPVPQVHQTSSPESEKTSPKIE